MKKKNKLFITCFIMPCVVVLLVMYFLPIARTILMSFFKTGSITAPVSTWTFRGLENYTRLLNSLDFIQSLTNILKLWVFGGIICLSLALLFAVVLTGNIKCKHFFRSIVYMPNIISVIALGNVWVYYVFNYDFGLLNQVLNLFGLESIKWLGPDLKFWAMLVALIFSGVGYYMLIFISGIERIPNDILEAATIDGASSWDKFRYITLPLMKGTIKTNLTFWTITVIQSFVWTQVFSPIDAESSTIVPISYMYEVLFGSMQRPDVDVGLGAAIGVLVAVIVQVAYILFDWLFKTNDLEY